MKSRQKHDRFQYSVENVIDKPYNWTQMTRLMGYMKPYLGKWLPFAILSLAVVTLVRLGVPFLISIAIDEAIQKKNLMDLFEVAGMIMGLYVLGWMESALRIRWTNQLGHSVIYDLRQELFTHIQRLSHRFFDKRSAGSILVRITNDINSLQDLFTNGVVNIFIDIVMLIGILVMLFVLSPTLTFGIMIVLPLMFLISIQLRKKIRLAWQTVRLKQSKINSHLNESIQGIRVTQSFTQEQENLAFFERMNMDNFEAWRTATQRSATFRPIVDMAGAIGTAILIWLGATLIQADTISIGVFVAFAYYLGNFWEPISRLGQVYNQLLMAMASSERIFEFLDEKPSVPEQQEAVELTDIQGSIVLEDVQFSYDGQRDVLHHIDLKIKAGETIALVGHTGSGKTSIVNLICRFYDPTGGRVKIDGVDLKKVRLETLRSQVSIVLQDTFIFSGSIMDNIRFGRPDATDEEVIQAACAIGADFFISRLPNGYHTEVEERGNVLSQGERQLLSFARALLANPKILILDEATASIDTETEVKVQQALKRLLKGRTAIVIAHRLSTIREVDTIVVLDHGTIIEQGNHTSLMDRRGVYYDLVLSQFRVLGT
ncbi:ABC transporter ATP-binding protein [Brevibacillus nitrificans]|uniref:ABC transporter ATP-binding protein n=1 Tax=Brevibacillus nitrificans TaxID=651560 RepID=UPI00285701FC|nr:ABC transporter ATP-binding protein [Brevibacillus nitrificans]MDR7315620.1 putative ABC transport system ATP-binding protein/ATP-binding cassette subfamily B protein [Brevibacillus nitrificans]